jgi:N-acetyl sugar amidotransferase
LIKVLIICSGNVKNFSFEKHHAFIYDQINAIEKDHSDIYFDYFFIRGKGIFGYLKNFSELKKKLQNEKFDLIHAHYALSSLLANMQIDVPVITTFHGSDINFWYLNLLSSLVNIRSNQSIFVSEKLKNKIFIKGKKDNMHIIPCGINLDIFQPVDKLTARKYFNLDPKKPYILFSSSFDTKVKNYPLASKAIGHLKDDSIKLLELKDFNRKEVNLLLNAVDVALMTSYSEGSPQFIKEAMAVNCPIVTTDVGDVREIIKDTKGCFITGYNSSEIADKIKKALSFKTQTLGRKNIFRFDNEHIGEIVYSVYLKTIGLESRDVSNYRCKLGIWDNSVPGIKFDEHEVSNYARIQQHLMKDYPLGEEGEEAWYKLSESIKRKGKVNQYDCIIGVSGGTDSSYLLHVAKKYGLKPLAVNLDNGWSSNIAVKNIKKVTSALDIDLETFVIDYEEIKDILRAFLRSGLPWIDAPSDMAIQAILYKIAKREKVKYILVGNDFRSEGKQPTEWTYSDQKLLRYVHKKYGTIKLKTYPRLSFFSLFYIGYLNNIKMLSPYNYLSYDKESAKEFLIKEYRWEYYGEHHHENLFTKWVIGYWMYEKFGIDKRIITYSAQILNGKMSRDEALDIIGNPPYNKDSIQQETSFVLKKLDISKSEYDKIWASPNKSFRDYPSYYPIIYRFAKTLAPILKYIVVTKPKIFYEIEGRI